MQRRSFIAAAAVLSSALAALPAQAQTKWDLPSPYPAFNFHSENIAQFAKDVESATGGQLRITPRRQALGNLRDRMTDQSRVGCTLLNNLGH